MLWCSSLFVGEQEPEQVLDLRHVSGGEEKMEPERKQRSQWTVQRIRLSPQEKHLAATLKSTEREDLRSNGTEKNSLHSSYFKLLHLLNY